MGQIEPLKPSPPYGWISLKGDIRLTAIPAR